MEPEERLIHFLRSLPERIGLRTGLFSGKPALLLKRDDLEPVDPEYPCSSERYERGHLLILDRQRGEGLINCQILDGSYAIISPDGTIEKRLPPSTNGCGVYYKRYWDILAVGLPQISTEVGRIKREKSLHQADMRDRVAEWYGRWLMNKELSEYYRKRGVPFG